MKGMGAGVGIRLPGLSSTSETWDPDSRGPSLFLAIWVGATRTVIFGCSRPDPFFYLPLHYFEIKFTTQFKSGVWEKVIDGSRVLRGSVQFSAKSCSNPQLELAKCLLSVSCKNDLIYCSQHAVPRSQHFLFYP